jgi:formylglycine-generating enzyme required for sulfatase activity
MTRHLAKFFAPALLLGLLSACQPATESQDPLFFSKTPPPPNGMVLVPAGAFVMGSDKTDTEGRAKEFGSMKPWYLDEHPAHQVTLPDYFIDTYEVSNRAYGLFLHATGNQVPSSWNPDMLSDANGDKPVTGTNWFEADQFCTWLGKRLPTEAEWEKAARGPNGLEYPWGPEFDAMKGNTGATRLGGVMPGGHFPEGASPYGVNDLVGNVWEWTASWYQPYPGSDYNNDDFGDKYRVIRGGGWGGIGHYTLDHFYRGAYRFYIDPSIGFNDAGFRCAKSP